MGFGQKKSHHKPSQSHTKDTCINCFPPPHLHRYLLYDVNPPEGFNLRRDVYIRMASLAKTLRNDGGDWVLVLPPWGRLYHWQSPNIYQIRIPWGEFFSLTSLQANVPVIEYEEFIAGQQSNTFFAPLFYHIRIPPPSRNMQWWLIV